MVSNPCICGCSLQVGTKIVAIVGMIFALIVCIWHSLFLHNYIEVHKVLRKTILHSLRGSEEDFATLDDAGVLPKPSIVIMVIFITYILVNIVHIILAGILLIGANQTNLAKCRISWIGLLFLMVISLVVLLGIIFTSGEIAWRPATFLIPAGEILFHLFCIWTVVAFMEEIKNGLGDQHRGVVYSAPNSH